MVLTKQQNKNHWHLARNLADNKLIYMAPGRNETGTGVTSKFGEQG